MKKLIRLAVGGGCLVLAAVTARAGGMADGCDFSHTGFYRYGGGVDRTVFQWGVAGGRLNFCFEVVDDTPCDVAELKTERDLDSCDRVELYFSPTSELSKPYYAIEMDAKGNVLDYSVLYGHPFDYRWRNKTVVTKAERTAAGYRVSGSIALTELRSFGIVPERFWMGAFRADFKNGGELAGWYSYLPHPSGRANFHVPQMFFPVASAVPWP